MNKNRNIKTLIKKISVAAASAAMATSAMIAPAFAAAGTNYEATIGGTKTTTFDKFVVMDKQANVPNINFTFAVTAGAPMNYNVDEKKVEVLAGITPKKVTMAGVDNKTANTITFKLGDLTKEDENALVKNYDNQTEKYAQKTATLDFSAVVFPEPGIYRYVVTESGRNQGITNDADSTRIIDVYVENDAEAIGAGKKQLKISGYVLHSNVNDAPEISMDENKFGSTGTYVGTKSQGFTNEYTSHDLTFKHSVKGNQASHDKYYKFTVKITGAVAGTKYDVDISKADANVPSNAATLDSYEGQSNPTSITVGPEGTATTAFYLQTGQEIQIKGLADNTGYDITQDAEDTKMEVLGGDAAKANIKKDSVVSIQNSKEGVIPTGVVMTVAPFAVVTLVGGVGLVTMAMKKKKKDE